MIAVGPSNIWKSSRWLRRSARTTLGCAVIVLIGAFLFRIDGFAVLSNELFVSAVYVAIMAGVPVGMASAVVFLFLMLRNIISGR